ncbi:MAG: hypothetical protein JW818_05475, partial [Pirellulales bacterium]|nr:hypothetical protein [Pirellulales bacterium]
NDIDSIWIAEGTYKPSAELEPGDPRSASFSLIDGVTLYGGFSGNETSLEQRDWTAHVVTLSGDLGTPDDNSDNAYTVVYCGETIEAGLDGVLIAGANANGALDNDFKERRYGGGVFNRGTLTVTNSTFLDNSVEMSGGGIYSYYGTLTVTDSLFSGNSAVSSGGGGIMNRHGTLTVAHSTLSGNSALSGGGISSVNSLIVTDCTILDNIADRGGGIEHHGSTLMLTNSTISGNSAKEGGGIYSNSSPDSLVATITNSTISDNTGFIDGGGIWQSGLLSIENCIVLGNLAYNGGGIFGHGTLTVTDSAISYNLATRGGGINQDATLTVANSSLSCNRSLISGGGIRNESGSVTITNSTVSGNLANAYGGGISNHSGTLTITSSTLSANSVNYSSSGNIGSGIYSNFSSSVVTLNNTIVAANNTSGGRRDVYCKEGTLSGCCNLIGDGSDQLGLVDGVDGNLIGTDEAPLDPLLSDFCQFDNGLWGQYLLPGSPALDAGDNNLALDPAGLPLSEDIRGSTRIQNGTVDIGAVEGTPTGSPAQTYLVTSLDDAIASDGILTFREALEASNRNQPVGDAPAGSCTEQDVITFASGVTGSVPVDIDELTIMGDLRIEGPGAGLLTFQSNGQNRVFLILSAASVYLDGMTITGGSAINGGGICSFGPLIVANSLLSGNESDEYGGAIYCDSDALTLVNCIISDNTAHYGGGILNRANMLIVTNSTISGNTADVGGGIVSSSITFNTLSVANCIISGNCAKSSGGIRDYSDISTITNCSISDNVASVSNGGGITHYDGIMTLTNNTISDNSAVTYGGGIYNSSTIAVTNCTIFGNSASDGGGIYTKDFFSAVTLNNSIVATNNGTSGPDLYRYSGTLSGSFNLIGDGAGQSALVDGVDGNQVGTFGTPVDPILDTRGVPISGSPAINAGSNALAVDGQGSPLLVDASGRQRVIYGAVDIGAYEYGLPGDASEDYQVGPADAAVLASHWLSSDDVSWDDGDFNADGRVDDLDASIMAANWGNSVPEGSGPEQAQTPVVVEGARLVGPRRLETAGLVAPARTVLSLAGRMQTPVEGAGVAQASRSATVRPRLQVLAHDMALAALFGQTSVREIGTLSIARRKPGPLARPMVDLAMMEV